MDPTASWNQIANDLEAGNVAGAVGLASDLRGWLDRGGFFPHQPAPTSLRAATWHTYVWTVLDFLMTLDPVDIEA